MKITNHIFLLFLFSIIAFDNKYVQCSKILCLFPFGSKSLHLAGTRIAEILSEDNRHDVTLVTSFGLSSSPKKFKHVFLEDVYKHLTNKNENYFEFNILNPYETILVLNDYVIDFAKVFFKDSALKNLLKSEQKFDLIIIDLVYTEYLLYFGEYYGKVPIILYSSVNVNSWSNHVLGNFAPPSYVPHVLSDYSDEMTFFQRLNNFFISIVNYINLHYILLPSYDKIIKEHFPGAPDIHQYMYKSSLLLVNSDSSILEAIPKTPGMIDIGGFHIKSKTLPKDLEEIANKANDGLIFFCLGSNLKSSQIPTETIQMLLRVFSRLKQTVLWKFEEDDLLGKPKNVFIRKWLPQNDILAHNNTKLFITHAGWHSILESVYHGVPIVSLSVFIDQHTNGKKAAKSGYGEWMSFHEITEEKFENALKKVLENSSYTINVKKRSAILREKPIPPDDLLKYWVDFMIKHKGSSHLQVEGVKLSWYQYFLIDVVVFTLIIIIGFVVLFKKMFQLFFCKNVLTKTKEKKS